MKTTWIEIRKAIEGLPTDSKYVVALRKKAFAFEEELRERGCTGHLAKYCSRADHILIREMLEDSP